jgi:hypothetical protein
MALEVHIGTSEVKIVPRDAMLATDESAEAAR